MSPYWATPGSPTSGEWSGFPAPGPYITRPTPYPLGSSRQRRRRALRRGPAVGEVERARGELPAVDELQARRAGGVAEQALTAPEHDREDHQPPLVDEPALDQSVVELGAARDEDVALALLEVRHRVEVGEHRRYVPGRVGQRRGHHVLGHRVHLVREAGAVLHVRPRGREPVVSHAPGQMPLVLHQLVE